MAAASDYLENALLSGVLRGITFNAPAAVYVALFTVAPTDTNAGFEVGSGLGYVRKIGTFSVPANGVTSNTTNIDFGLSTSPWGTIVSCGIYDAVTGGNLLFHGQLTGSIVVGAAVRIQTGSLIVTLA